MKSRPHSRLRIYRFLTVSCPFSDSLNAANRVISKGGLPNKRKGKPTGCLHLGHNWSTVFTAPTPPQPLAGQGAYARLSPSPEAQRYRLKCDLLNTLDSKPVNQKSK